MKRYDAIVLGLGAMGAATAWRLAGMGLSVLGLERFEPAHDKGSSHGETRILRQAYFEGAHYAPMAKASLEGWRQLEAECGHSFFQPCGALMVGSPESLLVQGSLATAKDNKIEHEYLRAEALRERFPQFRFEADETGLFEPGAGVLRVEAALLGFQQRARALGAELQFLEAVSSWEESAHGPIRVFSNQGEYETERLVLCAGAWSPSLLASYQPSLRVERVMQYWFDAQNPDNLSAKNCPAFLNHGPANRFFYAVPGFEGGSGMKVAYHQVRTETHPDQLIRQASEAEIAQIRQDAQARIPGLGEALIKQKACIYTSTKDGHFLLGRHPNHQRVLLAAGFSGHGFKFAPLIGEIMAELLYYGASKTPLSLFDPKRNLIS